MTGDVAMATVASLCVAVVPPCSRRQAARGNHVLPCSKVRAPVHVRLTVARRRAGNTAHEPKLQHWRRFERLLVDETSRRSMLALAALALKKNRHTASTSCLTSPRDPERLQTRYAQPSPPAENPRNTSMSTKSAMNN